MWPFRINKQTETLAHEALLTLREMAEAQKQQALVFQKWIDGFRSQGPAHSHTLTDEKEVALERLDTLKDAMGQGIEVPPDLVAAQQALLGKELDYA